VIGGAAPVTGGVAAATWPDQYKAGYLQSWHLTIERELFPDDIQTARSLEARSSR
jgi:hypothetical protein